MSRENEGQDLNKIAHQAEKDLNSYEKTQASDSTKESGVNKNVEHKFPGAEVNYGSSASGASDNREIPLSEGGDVNPKTGQLYKARDFEGEGGPEDKDRIYAQDHGGENDVRGNVR